jgi:hypothetical protein
MKDFFDHDHRTLWKTTKLSESCFSVFYAKSLTRDSKWIKLTKKYKMRRKVSIKGVSRATIIMISRVRVRQAAMTRVSSLLKGLFKWLTNLYWKKEWWNSLGHSILKFYLFSFIHCNMYNPKKMEYNFVFEIYK